MNKNIILRKAVANEASIIWEILAAAIQRRKADGSDQWQDGYPNKIEELAKEQHIHSLRADTNFDNAAMLHLLQKMGYHYCGEVMMRGGKRKAFEKYCE